MKLLINTSSTFKGGGIQVAKSFIEECKVITNNEYYVILSKALSKSIEKENFPSNFTFYVAPFRPATKFFSFHSHNYFLKKAENIFKPDIVFTTSGPSYWRPKCKHLMGFNIPHYIYPESPYFKSLEFKKRIWWRAMKIFAYINFKYNADAYVVQTNDVRDRLKKFIKEEKVYTVFNTINSHYLNPKKISNILPIEKKDEFRLLTLSAWYPHKNLAIIKDVITNLRKNKIFNIRFILTIDDEEFKNNSLNNFEEIVNLGKVKIEEAASLYSECDAMFLPTLLECFSASYVEAMHMKKPILTSDMGFAHTICKDSAIYFDPIDPQDIVSKIKKITSSKNVYSEMVRNGVNRSKIFGTAKQRAEKYLEICKTLFNEN